jgi:hypothetical protein
LGKFTAADDAAILAGRAAGQSWDEIAVRAAGHTPRSCRARFEFALAARAARAASRPWSDGEDGRLILLRDLGLKWSTVAATLGRENGTLCRIRYLRVTGTLKERPKPKRQRRACLSCARVFRSHGPGNRLCTHCQADSANVSPMCPDPGGYVSDLSDTAL